MGGGQCFIVAVANFIIYNYENCPNCHAEAAAGGGISFEFKVAEWGREWFTLSIIAQSQLSTGAIMGGRRGVGPGGNRSKLTTHSCLVIARTSLSIKIFETGRTRNWKQLRWIALTLILPISERHQQLSLNDCIYPGHFQSVKSGCQGNILGGALIRQSCNYEGRSQGVQ